MKKEGSLLWAPFQVGQSIIFMIRNIVYVIQHCHAQCHICNNFPQHLQNITPNDTMDPFGKLTSMVQVEEGVVDLNEWRNKYFKSMATNHISCSTPRKEDEVPFIATKHNANKLLCMYIQVLFCSLVFLWGSFALCHFS